MKTDTMQHQQHPIGRMSLATPTLLWAIGTLASLVLLGGCNIVAPVSYLVHGPGTVDAQHKIENRPTVVFVDDRDNVVNPVTFRRAIAEKVSEELMARRLVTHTISPHDAMSLVSRYDTNKDVMPIDAIGRAVGAEQIIYIEMVAFQDHQEGHIPRPIGICRVRVIDIENRERVFPPPESDQPYHMIQVMPREVDPELYRSRATRSRISEMLAMEMGDRIAKLFYKHEARELGGTLTSR